MSISCHAIPNDVKQELRRRERLFRESSLTMNAAYISSKPTPDGKELTEREKFVK